MIEYHSQIEQYEQDYEYDQWPATSVAHLSVRYHARKWNHTVGAHQDQKFITNLESVLYALHKWLEIAKIDSKYQSLYYHQLNLKVVVI